MLKVTNKSVGLLGGSFDPVHKGHVAISKIALKKIELDKSISLNDVNEKMLDNIMKNFYSRLQFNNLENFQKYLNNNLQKVKKSGCSAAW